MADGRESRETPKSIESEKALLGGIVRDPAQLPDIAAIVSEDDWYLPEHQNIWRLLLDMRRLHIPIDGVTVPEMIAKQPDVGRYVSAAYILQLESAVISTANLGYYAGEIVKASQHRRLQAAVHDIADAAKDTRRAPEEIRDAAMKRLASLSTGQTKATWRSLGDLVPEELAALDERAVRKQDVTGLPSRFKALDAMTAGWKGGEFIIIAARPGMGKTAFMLALCEDAATLGHRTVGVFSLEMTHAQLLGRTLCSMSDVEATQYRTGRFDEMARMRVGAAGDAVMYMPILVDDSTVHLDDILAMARRLHRDRAEGLHPLGMIVVDYLGLVRHPDSRMPRERQIGEISGAFKSLAKELGIAVIALAQLNRDVEGRKEKIPNLADLRDSGSLEQDADIVMMLYREHYYNKDADVEGADVIIAKQRSGRTGTVHLRYTARFVKFGEWTP